MARFYSLQVQMWRQAA